MRDRLVPPAPLAGRLRRAPGLSGLLGAAGPVGLSAYSFFSNSGITLGPGDTVLGWQGGGQFPIELVPVSTAPVLADNVVEFSEASRLGYDLQTPLDLPGGFSAWLLMRVPDPAVLTGSRRAFRLLNSSSAAQLQVIFPNAAGQVLMNAGGTNVVASGLTDQELSEFAVWGFEWNAYNDTARITRNGVVVSAAPTGTVGPIIDYARPEVGVGSTIQVARALMYVEPRTVAEAEIISTLQQSSFAASFAPQTVAHDAGVVALGTIATAGNIGAMAIVGGPITDQPGDNGGTFTVPDNLSVTFDATALAAALADGAQLTTSVTLQLRDALGQTVNVPLDVTVSRIDDAPVAAGALADLVLTQGQAMAPVDVSGDFTDAGDTLSFAAAGLPAGLSMTTAGVISGVPAAAVAGQVITITATDIAGQTAQSAFQITVNAAAGLVVTQNYYSIMNSTDDDGTPNRASFHWLGQGEAADANVNYTMNGPPLTFLSSGALTFSDPLDKSVGYVSIGDLVSDASITAVYYDPTNFHGGVQGDAAWTQMVDNIVATIDRMEGFIGITPRHLIHQSEGEQGAGGVVPALPDPPSTATQAQWDAYVDFHLWSPTHRDWYQAMADAVLAVRPGRDVDVLKRTTWMYRAIRGTALYHQGPGQIHRDPAPHGTVVRYLMGAMSTWSYDLNAVGRADNAWPSSGVPYPTDADPTLGIPATVQAFLPDLATLVAAQARGELIPPAAPSLADITIAQSATPGAIDFTIDALNEAVTGAEYSTDNVTWAVLPNANVGVTHTITQQSGGGAMTAGATYTCSIRLTNASVIAVGPAGSVPQNVNAGVAGDVTAPILTLPTDVQTGQTTATLTVTSDEANGTLGVVCVPTGDPAPSGPQILAGQNSVGGAAAFAASTTSPIAGTNTFNATGLTAGTSYDTYYFQRDAASNDSNIAQTDGFTTDAAAGFNPTSLSPHVLFDLQTPADLEVDPRATPIVQASADGRVGGVQNAGISAGGTYTADINPGTLVGAGRLWFPNANDNFVEERPTLRSAGGVEYLDFGAGESGKWHWASTPFTDTLYALLAFRYSATGLVDYDRLLSFDLQDGTAFDNFSAGHAAFVMNTGTPNRLTLNIGGAEDLTIAAPAAGTDLVAELIIAPAGNEIAIDGGTPVQNATNYGARLSDRFILMNDRSGNGIEGRVHGLFVRNSVPSGTERAQLVTYFGALQGRVI